VHNRHKAARQRVNELQCQAMETGWEEPQEIDCRSVERRKECMVDTCVVSALIGAIGPPAHGID